MIKIQKKITNYDSEETIDLETLLLKLLSKNPNGIKYQDIVKYKNCVLNICKKNNVKVVIYGINKPEIERAVLDYPELFLMFNNVIYKESNDNNLNDDYFTKRNSPLINNILDEALIEYKEISTPKRVRRLH